MNIDEIGYSMFSAEESRITIEIMNIVTKRNYLKLDDRFKSLIKVDNPYLSLFMNLIKLSAKEVKKFSRNLFKLHYFMTSKNLEDPCPHCYLNTKNMWEHKSRCLDQKLKARRFLVLSIDDRSYLCQLGCRDARFKRLHSIYKHYYTSHTRSELKKWGINRDRLEEGLED